MIAPKVVIGFIVAVNAAAVAAESSLSAKEILQKMTKAMAQTNFRGTVVFLKNDKLEPMKYSHTANRDKEQERLVSLNSPPREIVRDSDEIRCFYKLTRQVIVDHRPYEHSFIVDVPKNLDELDASYQFEKVGEEDVAMVASHVIAIQPKDDYRYVRKIWIGKSQYLPLKATVYDMTGAVLEQVVFTEISVDKPAVAETNTVAVTEKSPTDEDSAQKQAQNGLSLFEVSAMPKGFKQIFFTRKPLQQSNNPVDHLLLSDGFASVSVYLEAKKSAMENRPAIPEGLHKVGAVNSLSRSLADYQLTVLGEVPAATVKYIAEGVKLRPSAKP